ncbi:MAG: hypothetical protein K0R51_2423, partial [Cytophagaceae bacterium]|nr:hypothetical protein [Cytophagaceae bacterium]
CPSQSYELSQTGGTSEDWRSIATDGQSAVYALRHAYLGAKVAKFDLNGNFITEWEGNAQGGTFASPLHVTTDKEGNVYVGYSYANNYDAGIRKFNSNGDVVGSSILVPNSSFNLKGLTVDLSGNIYACNAQNIFKYNSLGNLQATWSNAYSGDIARLAVDVNGNVYFTTNTTHKVVKLNASGTVISNWNAETTQAFDNPMDLDIDGCNNVIVCTNQGVKKFTNAGVLLTTVDNTRRSYVAIDGQSNIYTATADIKKMSLSSISNAVISSFTPTSGPAGTVVTITGSNFYSVTGISFNGVSAPTFTVNSATQITVTVPVGAETGKISVLLCGQETQSTDIYTVECPLGNSNYEHVREIYFNFGGDFYIASDAYGNLYRINGSQILYKYNIRGTILWSFDLRSIVPNIAAECLAVDAAGDIYIGNDNNSVIQIEANGNYKWTYSHPSLLSPEAIAVDYTGGYLYVADFTNHVKVFNLGGSFARTITAGPSPYGFDNGFGIAVNSVGEVYVTDDYYSGSSNVYRFSRLGAQLTTWNVGSYYISQTGRVKVDPYDNVYVSGDFPGKIVKLSPSGTYIGETQGSYWCYDFTVGPSCYIYDAPAGNVFAPSISGLRTSQQPEDMVSISGDRSALQVYPNPTYGNVTIIAAYDHYNMVLYDAQGMEVWQGQSNTREFRLNDLSLKPGVYILKIISGSETQQTKLIIKN